MSRCSKPNVSDGTGWHFNQCSRQGTITEKGKSWCFQHAPSKVKTRKDERHVRYEARMDALLAPEREVDRLRAINAKLLAALPSLNRYGHHDHDCIPDVYGEGIPCPCEFNLAMDQARAVIEEAKERPR